MIHILQLVIGIVVLGCAIGIAILFAILTQSVRDEIIFGILFGLIFCGLSYSLGSIILYELSDSEEETDHDGPNTDA